MIIDMFFHVDCSSKTEAVNDSPLTRETLQSKLKGTNLGP